MLREHVEAAGARRVAVELARLHAEDRRLAFQHLEAVGRDEDRLRGLVHPVVGAPDPLQQARDALRRADLDHLIDAAPVDAEIERGRRDHGAQLPGRHRGLDPAALGDVEAAVMQRDRHRLRVQLPERLEHQFGLRAGVDEHDRHGGGPDALQHLGRAVEAHMAGPGQPPLRQHHRQPWRRAVLLLDELVGPGIGADGGGMRDGRGQADPPRGRREGGEAGEAEGELVAALGAGEGMDLVDHDRLQVREHRGRVRQREQHGEAFRRGQQDVRRLLALALAAAGGGVAGAGLDTDGKRHLLDRHGEIAGDVGRERLQRADIEGVDAGAGRAGKVDQARQEPGQRLAAAGRRDQQHRPPGFRRLQHRALVPPQRPAARSEPGPERFWQCSVHGSGM